MLTAPLLESLMELPALRSLAVVLQCCDDVQQWARLELLVVWPAKLVWKATGEGVNGVAGLKLKAAVGKGFGCQCQLRTDRNPVAPLAG